jgi:hypothetical protein
VGCTGIKKYNGGLIVDSESTRHYGSALGEFGDSGEVHPALANLYHLFLPFALIVCVGGLPLRRSPRLRTVLDKVRGAAAIETTVAVVSLTKRRGSGPKALLLFAAVEEELTVG